jgi:hypothetical protein
MDNGESDPQQWFRNEEDEISRLRRKMERKRASISSTALALWALALLGAIALAMYAKQVIGF